MRTTTSMSVWSVDANNTRWPSPVNSRTRSNSGVVNVRMRARWSGPCGVIIVVPTDHFGSG
jgi:hypothetical protein